MLSVRSLVDVLRDARASKRSLLQYVESHSDDVTDLCFHASHPSILLSGSTDGLVNLYDTTVTDEDDALTQVFNHGSSIAHTGFLSDHEVFALSHDEIFSIYDTNRSDHVEAPTPTYALGDLRPQLQCEYVVDLVSSGSTGPVLGAGSHRFAFINSSSFSGLQQSSLHQLDVVPLRRGSEWTLDTVNTLRLPGAHGEEVVRSLCFSRDVSFSKSDWLHYSLLHTARETPSSPQAKTVWSKHGGHQKILPSPRRPRIRAVRTKSGRSKIIPIKMSERDSNLTKPFHKSSAVAGSFSTHSDTCCY